MPQWPPHATVACVVEKDGRYLMVEERDKQTGNMVFNQPAGHVEEGETLQEAALRETLEETGWQVELVAVLGLTLYRATAGGPTYLRTSFVARALDALEDAALDPDIHAVHWLSYAEILDRSASMRSPIALAVIERHRQGIRYPLALLHTS